MGLAEDERWFEGLKDDQAVIVSNVFEGSPIAVASGIGLLEDRENGIVIEGPSHHLKFLYPFLLKLRNDSIDSNEFGIWVGVTWAKTKKWLNLFYLFGDSLRDRMELLEHKFRRDIAFSCGLRLSEKARMIVRVGTRIDGWDIGLPEELEENGHIEFPQIIALPGTVLQ